MGVTSHTHAMKAGALILIWLQRNVIVLLANVMGSEC
uniref:Uncharacterized protein n=1 Tax=Anguilla anguilla TaxID=7936 RepID=A0A0E9PUR0_ANGAN